MPSNPSSKWSFVYMTSGPPLSEQFRNKDLPMNPQLIKMKTFALLKGPSVRNRFWTTICVKMSIPEISYHFSYTFLHPADSAIHDTLLVKVEETTTTFTGKFNNLRGLFNRDGIDLAASWGLRWTVSNTRKKVLNSKCSVPSLGKGGGGRKGSIVYAFCPR